MTWRPPPSWRDRADWIPLDTTLGQSLRGVRWAALIAFAAVLAGVWSIDGVPFDREGLLLWLAIGLGAFCIGRHPVWLLWVAIDFVPFAAVLVAYDYLRGWSDSLGMQTWWTPQLDLDRALFLGREPTVWLQEHLKHADLRWYDTVVTLSYYSFFFLPYVTAAVMWLRSRADFYRWSLRFVSLSLLGFGLFALMPSAPPWAAAACTGEQVSGHPYNPPCMGLRNQFVPHNLLGAMTTSQPGAAPWVQQLAGRGFFELHLRVANNLLEKGRLSADAVAAVPSLHLGGTVLFVLFIWSRVRRGWRPLLVAYPLVMTFSLVYSAEHYLTDCIAGALVAGLVHIVANRIERRSRRTADADTLAASPAPPEPSLETECPPTPPLHAIGPFGLPPGMTPSST